MRRGKKEDVIIFLLLAVILFLIFLGLFIATMMNNSDNISKNKSDIIFISVETLLNYTEVKNIDYNYSSELLAKWNITFLHREQIEDPDNDLKYSAEPYNDPHLIALIYVNETTKRANMIIMDTSLVPYEELENEKKYIESFGNKIAIACNLTVDWYKASWSISYQDSFIFIRNKFLTPNHYGEPTISSTELVWYWWAYDYVWDGEPYPTAKTRYYDGSPII